VTAALRRYADTLMTGNESFVRALHDAATAFGTNVRASARPRTEPPVGPLTTQDRHLRATTGRLRLLRRAVWQREYLPGLAALERTGIESDRAAQAQWQGQLVTAFSTAARQTLAGGLAELEQRADAAQRQIKDETNFVGTQAECDQLSRDLPELARHIAAVGAIITEARVLVEQHRSRRRVNGETNQKGVVTE
jgi:hypothetical protein